MGVGAGLYMCDVVVKSSRSLSHLLMSSCTHQSKQRNEKFTFRPMSIVAKRSPISASDELLLHSSLTAECRLAHWHYIANTIELVLPSAHANLQPKRQIDRFNRIWVTVWLSVPSVCDVGVLWPNSWMDQDETWHWGRPRPSHIVLDGDPAPTPQKGHSPQFSAHVCCGQTAGWI